MIHEPFSTYTDLDGEALAAWWRRMDDNLVALGEPWAVRNLLGYLAVSTPDDGHLRNLPKQAGGWAPSPSTCEAAERLSHLGLIYLHRAGYSVPVAARLLAFDPAPTWPQPAEPLPTPNPRKSDTP